MLKNLKQMMRAYANTHTPGAKPNVFIFSSPRSGSTWLMELIRTQPGFKSCEEPLNLRNPDVQQHLGFDQWQQLYDDNASEQLHPYFAGFCNGSMRFMNGNPLNAHHRFATSRIVFKILHGGEDRINWFAEQFNGRIVLLLRHPLAVSISRKTLPRLTTFLNSAYQTHLTPTQKERCLQIIQHGSHLEKGVLSWCLQNAISLNQTANDWTIVTYEQLVLDPDPLIHHLAKAMELPHPEKMIARLRQPSATYRKSDEETKMLLTTGQANDRQNVVNKWRNKVDKEAGKSAMNILTLFGLDIYSYEEDLPTERFWLKDNQCVPTP